MQTEGESTTRPGATSSNQPQPAHQSPHPLHRQTPAAKQSPASQPTSPSVRQPTQSQPSNQLTSQPASHPSNELTNHQQSVNQPTNHPSIQPTRHTLAAWANEKKKMPSPRRQTATCHQLQTTPRQPATDRQLAPDTDRFRQPERQPACRHREMHIQTACAPLHRSTPAAMQPVRQ